MITKQIATTLSHRAILHHTHYKDAGGSPARCRVNGKCKTWKTRPEDFRLPVKYGLRTCFYITPADAANWKVA